MKYGILALVLIQSLAFGGDCEQAVYTIADAEVQNEIAFYEKKINKGPNFKRSLTQEGKELIKQKVYAKYSKNVNGCLAIERKNAECFTSRGYLKIKDDTKIDIRYSTQRVILPDTGKYASFSECTIAG